MVKRCAWGTCNSDDRYKNKPYMHDVTFWPVPKPKTRLPETREWVKSCGRKNFTIDNVDKHAYVCSKHFIYGKPTKEFPYPTSATETEKSVKKRRKSPARKELFNFNERKRTPKSKVTPNVHAVPVVGDDINVPIPTVFTEIMSEPKKPRLRLRDQFVPEESYMVPENDMSDHNYAKNTTHVPVETASVSVQTYLCFDDLSNYSDSEIIETGEMKRKLTMNDVFKSDKSCKFYRGRSIVVLTWLCNFLRTKAASMVYWNSADTFERERSETPKR